ncbi:hypothetical protein CLAFUW4_01977 [Fulvia fulva]|uniref:Uncharacterized protein n=1 Tax=Passalora fulva TaxID=5499 RepID=A0A9Q8P2Y2_PASFU|nr:uncharacterized protein CLAFUR5_01970 [Fulvia fulva]KAK4635294.1 hypothetical protein CLAFUR4_01972 [Fulvia fulva]KAK4636453.1 hypothetical protein CLAFUR0_01974 [Fulvia fulva]UJO11176.1 hypothetical protein CLAFUR5_01970 [Fulvia fulva]WPV09667.1 hypothetical protein CLAFUW4_01977 [Fulvia fulva]WPV23738.1 hypothetical protein CLAFUW7_01977 [Fulvia fulva]
MSSPTAPKKSSTCASGRPSTSPSSSLSKPSSNTSQKDAFSSWLNIQNGKIVPKSQLQPPPDPKLSTSFDDDSDLSDDEEFFETDGCGKVKPHSQMEAAVSSFIQKRKARSECEGVKEGEECQGWWRRRKEEKAWQRERMGKGDGYVY